MPLIYSLIQYSRLSKKADVSRLSFVLLLPLKSTMKGALYHKEGFFKLLSTLYNSASEFGVKDKLNCQIYKTSHSCENQSLRFCEKISEPTTGFAILKILPAINDSHNIH